MSVRLKQMGTVGQADVQEPVRDCSAGHRRAEEHPGGKLNQSKFASFIPL